MNVLFTCAGRRNYLLGYFREALGESGQVIAADSSPMSAAVNEADIALTLPRVDSAGYVDRLLDVCRELRVGLLVSLNDHELALLASARERFAAAGTQVVVSCPEVIERCFDKLATLTFARRLGVAGPYTVTTLEAARSALRIGRLAFPLFVKPRWGTASIGVERVENREELELVWQLAGRRLRRQGLRGAETRAGLLIQEALPGIEYGLDVINDLTGRYQTTLAKQKLAMRAGETDRAVIVQSPTLIKLGRRIGEALKHVGNLDCDVFMHGDQVYLLELNPRFGGGYPFSAEAGARLPDALLAWAQGLAPPLGWERVQPGQAYAKCDRLVNLRYGAAAQSDGRMVAHA
ncbi:ATP-grasp domain-containing protein [Billgrantia lactosivorans]|uniref:ATP-grasp domain-containing protein n=1 Tax=Billgrantia lactosivorans TaxID=2185141 RepID=UPI000DAD2AE8|nr:ATP-grasp domain-containing protein [Halomonas lactosivorans]